MNNVLPILYFFMLAVFLRWPSLPYLDTLPMNTNFPLHALAALDLSEGGSPFRNLHLEWPIGTPVRYLAWPLLLIAIPLNWFINPIPAMNLAIVLWLTIQGYGLYWLLTQLFVKPLNCYVAATLALLTPQTLMALGNGQFENIAPFPLLFCYPVGFVKNYLRLFSHSEIQICFFPAKPICDHVLSLLQEGIHKL